MGAAIDVGARVRWASDRLWGGRPRTFEGIVLAMVPRRSDARAPLAHDSARAKGALPPRTSPWDRYLVRTDDGRWLAPRCSRCTPVVPAPEARP